MRQAWIYLFFPKNLCAEHDKIRENMGDFAKRSNRWEKNLRAGEAFPKMGEARRCYPVNSPSSDINSYSGFDTKRSSLIVSSFLNALFYNLCADKSSLVRIKAPYEGSAFPLNIQ